MAHEDKIHLFNKVLQRQPKADEFICTADGFYPYDVIRSFIHFAYNKNEIPSAIKSNAFCFFRTVVDHSITLATKMCLLWRYQFNC